MSNAPRTLASRATGALVTLLLLAVTLVSAAYLLPSLFGYERYVITGGSMSGTFEKGSIAFEKPVPTEDLAAGDVITYLPPPDSGVSTLVTHRIISVKTDEKGARVYQTQGDANPDPDPWKFQLHGAQQTEVAFTVPVIGYAFVALADRETRMLVIGIPAGLIALASLVELVGNLAAARREARTAAPAGAHAAPAVPAVP